MKYFVEIAETLTTIIEVDAVDADEARSKVKAEYDNGTIVLMPDDCFSGTEFEVIEDYEGDADQKI